MNWTTIVISFGAGILLGVFYFGGLWLTVQKMPGSKSPYLLSGISFFLRTLIVMGGFYLLTGYEIEAMIAALAGFIAARIALSVKLSPAGAKKAGKGGADLNPGGKKKPSGKKKRS